MNFLKVKDENGMIHNLDAFKVIDFEEVNEGTTKSWFDYPLEARHHEVPWNADELTEAIYGADDVYEMIDCKPTELNEPIDIDGRDLYKKKKITLDELAERNPILYQRVTRRRNKDKE